jgi:uncharacterized protein (DUF58 family)
MPRNDLPELSVAPRSLRGLAAPVSAAQPPPARGPWLRGWRARARGKRRESPRASPIGPEPTAEAPRRKSFWPRKLRFTREGKYFLGITLGVGFAAINTGNNLLYLLLGMMLSLIIISGVMSELSLRHLTVKRRLPARAQVGRSHLVEIEVFNNKKRVPSYAIEVEDLRAGQPADKRCFFLKISPRSTQIAAYRRTPLRRGLEKHIGFRIATRFPFGLFEKSREVESPDALIIYPAVEPIRLPQRARGEHTGDSGPLGRGSGEETFSLRLMRDGDDPRDVYWRKSTTPGAAPVLRERAQEMRQEVEIVIDVYRGRDGHAHERPEERTLPDSAFATGDERTERRARPVLPADPFERRICEVASLAVAHLKRGDRVAVVTTAGERVVSDKARGIDPVLRFLALLEQRDAEQEPAALAGLEPAVASAPPSGEFSGDETRAKADAAAVSARKRRARESIRPPGGP